LGPGLDFLTYKDKNKKISDIHGTEIKSYFALLHFKTSGPLSLPPGPLKGEEEEMP